MVIWLLPVVGSRGLGGTMLLMWASLGDGERCCQTTSAGGASSLAVRCDGELLLQIRVSE